MGKKHKGRRGGRGGGGAPHQPHKSTTAHSDAPAQEKEEEQQQQQQQGENEAIINLLDPSAEGKLIEWDIQSRVNYNCLNSRDRLYWSADRRRLSETNYTGTC